MCWIHTKLRGLVNNKLSVKWSMEYRSNEKSEIKMQKSNMIFDDYYKQAAQYQTPPDWIAADQEEFNKKVRCLHKLSYQETLLTLRRYTAMTTKSQKEIYALRATGQPRKRYCKN